MNQIASIVFVFTWIVGIVISKGFWSTFFAIVFPFWSYYLVAERIVIKFL